jgi:hypothetical protein
MRLQACLQNLPAARLDAKQYRGLHRSASRRRRRHQRPIHRDGARLTGLETATYRLVLDGEVGR